MEHTWSCAGHSRFWGSTEMRRWKHPAASFAGRQRWRGCICSASTNVAALAKLCDSLCGDTSVAEGCGNPQKLVLVGFSAGARVTLEAAHELFWNRGDSNLFDSILLLDGVPGTTGCGFSDLPGVRILSLRGDPSAWNQSGAIQTQLPFVRDVRILGARHLDFEWPLSNPPPGCLDKLLRTRAHDSIIRETAHQVMIAFLLDAVGIAPGGFESCLQLVSREGRLVFDIQVQTKDQDEPEANQSLL